MKSYFVFIYTPGAAWNPGLPILEQPLKGHFAYMEQLQEMAILSIGGPFMDNEGAMGIIQANSLDEATRIIQNDPAVHDRIVEATVHPWHPSVPGCVEPRS